MNTRTDLPSQTAAAVLRVNGERLWQSLMELAQIGATPKGGVCRLTLTDLDKQGRDLVLAWAREAGMSVTIDKIGNGFMRRAGRNNALPPIMTGSHIDTQPTGGKFDGNYGVLAGLEVVRTLNDHGIQTEAPIEVAFWTNEEGSRFVPVMMGSGVFAKAFTLEHAYAATDTEGKTVRGELERIGYIGEQEPGDHPLGAYFETHIEQGPVLEDAEVTIGVVQGVLGIRWFDCTVTGMEAHAGPTPMALRKDALQVATHLMQEVVACALRHAPHGRGTVGMVQVHPNSRNVIPGRVKFSIDLRNGSDAAVNQMADEVKAYARKLADDSGLSIQIDLVSSYPAQAFHADCINAVQRAAAQLGYSHMPAVSGAGHDAVYAARLAPAGMIFIPCKDGISHNEIEDAKPEHITAGANVLLHAMLERAGVVQ
ncbi:N-carbamyl-L-cysteine amidohydrolase [Thiomonas arsenitoxydans]|jgi:N-carbamoyl-L-amino-acid hydrolase|uniref:N-carbamyl-L-cysteine amidohydrolase n=1 Tax=Thiomonas arsenitoxydans (strain DSM 22701 / CIP 110005 / 3As) TaxID=426114 RepID=D6CNS9_THIA3|nr:MULTISPECIES: Zn-dependent hydrolase [Thiomonas]OZB77406.1 MAG: Zn-dependent hydrolase [Thiomonas sp. 14-64-326]CAZ90207.1 N-carbamyl-L-cysteine amidohydrolase [Thiomonas arsenitoxydans]CDW93562.1 Amidase, hydantoinase/carbamoylase family [Thiomonas sp. CB2]CQR31018.1 N-carbamyl-L-cysteine amidohydrolase [Thiomonas arsenitoxydans]CQR36593.1 N-carbamyl-L-cysteine amidohydrolase [Thiomonas arsenitoxydans]